ncbi:hypothetical protein VFPPC_18206 [Pochonia chlamydosporia 170]|uniref:DUF7136 domain-containing protein n=1 Tax=Pochonia chlamydosporia 170 TaxID=1380566 RepID=A0A219AP92_METCM|nr:hypothetical protein VFPPC_18206 [Pochonia chlamydosporia 170]OWT42646.1 hypothetical protein VFPPC_18206 [Pochonia chlamydosporia 170]
MANVYVSGTWLYCLCWYLLTCSTGAAAASNSFPSTVEFDLIFPRNNTKYAPGPLFPFVFAIQNSQHAAALHPYLSYRAWRQDDYDGTLDEGKLDLTWANFSGSDPFFSYTGNHFSNVSKVEGTWVLAWETNVINCSHRSDEIGNGPKERRKPTLVIFTLEQGGQPPDLVASTQHGICDQDQEITTYTYNLTGEISDRIFGDNMAHRNSCAILSPTLSSSHPPANPCAVKIDSVIASSISAAITATECSGSLHPVVSCPVQKAATGRAGHFVTDGAIWFTVIFSCLTFILA